jgi:hypothetical protein
MSGVRADDGVVTLAMRFLGLIDASGSPRIGLSCALQALLTAISLLIDRAIARGDVQLMAVTADALDMLAERARQMQLCAPPAAQNDAETARAH